MSKILLLSHGNLAREVWATSRLVLGTVSNVEYLTLPSGTDLTKYETDIRHKVEEAEDGILIPYPEHNRFFINRELAQEYIDAHADLLDVIPFEDMVFQSMYEQSMSKREQAQEKTIFIAGLPLICLYALLTVNENGIF